MRNSITEQKKHIRKQGEGATTFIGDPGDNDVTDGIIYEFTIDAPKKRVWNILKDQNAWLPDIEWDLVVGDQNSQGKKTSFRPKQIGPDGKQAEPRIQRVLNVIPERLLVTSDPITKYDEGLIAGGVYVTTLAEHDGVTTVTVTMVKQSWSSEINRKEAMAKAEYWNANMQERWENLYIPTLRKLVMEN